MQCQQMPVEKCRMVRTSVHTKRKGTVVRKSTEKEIAATISAISK